MQQYYKISQNYCDDVCIVCKCTSVDIHKHVQVRWHKKKSDIEAALDTINLFLAMLQVTTK